MVRPGERLVTPTFTPMSQNMLRVACWMSGSGPIWSTPSLMLVGLALSGGMPVTVSWWGSRPQDHCTVPAPNTREPATERYITRWCVAEPES